MMYPDITFNISYSLTESARLLAELNKAENRFATQVVGRIRMLSFIVVSVSH